MSDTPDPQAPASREEHARAADQFVLRFLAIMREIVGRAPHDTMVLAATAPNDEEFLRALLEILATDAPSEGRASLDAALAHLDAAAEAKVEHRRQALEAMRTTAAALYHAGAISAEEARALGAEIEASSASLAPVDSVDQRAARLRRVVQRATEALGDPARAGSWLVTPNRALGGRPPVALLDTDEGEGDVVAVLVRIEHGVVG